jgi:hypothetical protein
MRTKIAIVFVTHGLGTVQQASEWSNVRFNIAVR